MKICVTGATGFIGKQLCNHLLENGHQVVALVRNIPDASSGLGDYSDGVDFSQGDVCKPESLTAAFANCDAVMHLAALFNNPECSLEEYQAVNVDGVKNVLETAQSSGVGRVVHCSTVGVASEGKPPYSEQAPYAPPEWDKYETTKAAGEQLARKFHQDTGYPVVIIRPAQVYGPGDEGKIKFYRMVKKGVIVSPGNTLKHLIYVSDLCRAFELAASSEEGFGEPMIIASPAPTPLKDLVGIVAAAIKVDKPKVVIPALPITILATVVETVFNWIDKKPPIFRRSTHFFTKSVAFDATNAAKYLGFESQVSTEEGVGATAEWYISNGHI